MTDRYNALTVVLESNMRDDDADKLLTAIRQMRGVLEVRGNVADSDSYVAEQRAKRELGDKLWQVLYPKEGSKT